MFKSWKRVTGHRVSVYARDGLGLVSNNICVFRPSTKFKFKYCYNKCVCKEILWLQQI